MTALRLAVLSIGTSAAVLCALTACAGSASSAPVTVTATVTVTPTATPTPAAAGRTDATSIAAAIKAAVPEVTKVVTINEDNDPNNVIGRPNGYTSAAVLYDSRAECSDGLGADCGATVEGWPTAADAAARAAYIQKILKTSTLLGSEYDIVHGAYLLRVAGAIKPSKEKAYSAAFTDQF